MPLDSLPGTLLVPLRTDTRELYLRSFRVRNPNAKTTENTFPWIDASCQADTLQLVFRDAVVVNNGVGLSTSTFDALDRRLADIGLTRLPAIGASGYVTASASVGGTTIFLGDEAKQDSTGLRFKCTATALYQNGDPIPMTGIDVGEQTNVDGGELLTWTTPRPGSGPTAEVITGADGVSGLTGGHGVESDEEAIARAINLKANPPASGNDAEYQADGAETPGVGVQQIFTFPCILGPGTIGFTLTVRPSKPGASRIPSGAQISAVLAYLTGLNAGSDEIFPCTITGQPADVALKVTWATGAPNWNDTTPWPTYYANPGQAVIVQSATDSVTFILRTQNGSYVGITSPVAGQVVGFYDQVGQAFRRKQILTVAGAGPWTITCDTSNAASDTGYTPQIGQRACPWSNSLDEVVPAVISYFDGLGPGEQVAVFFDAGQRQHRSPPSPGIYPHQISNRMTIPVLSLAAIQDVIVVEPTVPTSTAVGTPGVLSYLITLGFLAIFPE